MYKKHFKITLRTEPNLRFHQNIRYKENKNYHCSLLALSVTATTTCSDKMLSVCMYVCKYLCLYVCLYRGDKGLQI